MNRIRNLIIEQLVNVFLSLLKPETIRGLLSEALDRVEQFAEGTDNDLDDHVVEAISDVIREAFDLPPSRTE